MFLSFLFASWTGLFSDGGEGVNKKKERTENMNDINRSRVQIPRLPPMPPKQLYNKLRFVVHKKRKQQAPSEKHESYCFRVAGRLCAFCNS